MYGLCSLGSDVVSLFMNEMNYLDTFSSLLLTRLLTEAHISSIPV
jgi:hypothetical protein